MMQDDKQPVRIRNPDPTRNAEDFLGSKEGNSGITTGSNPQTSSSPDPSIQKDETWMKGGVLDEQSKNPVNTTPRGAFSDKAYKDEVEEGMSSVAEERANDMASEPTEE